MKRYGILVLFLVFVFSGCGYQGYYGNSNAMTPSGYGVQTAGTAPCAYTNEKCPCPCPCMYQPDKPEEIDPLDDGIVYPFPFYINPAYFYYSGDVTYYKGRPGDAGGTRYDPGTTP